MPRYEVTSPQGIKYEVNAPDGASEQDAIAYVQNNYMQQPKPQAAAAPAAHEPSMLDNAARLAGRVGRAAGAGALDILDLAGMPAKLALEGIANLVGNEEKLAFLRSQKPTAELFTNAVDSATNNALQSQNEGERYTENAARFVGGGLIPATGLAGMGIKGATSGAGKVLQFLAPRTATDVAGAATAGLANQYAQENDFGTAGTVLATLAGGAAPSLARATPQLARGAKEVALDAIAPTIDEEAAKLAQRAQEFNIPLSINQVAPTRLNSTIQKASQPLPFSGVTGFEQQQAGAFNKAIAKTLGQDAEALTPDVVNNFLSSSGKQFDNILSGKIVSATKDDLSALKTISSNARDFVTGDLADVINRNVNNLVKDIGKGKSIPGEKLASYRSRLIDNIPRAQNESKVYLYDLLEAVDNIAERSMSKQDVESLKILRRQWRNWKTVEPLLEGAKDGIINPTALMQRVASSPYIKAARKSIGEDDLVDLARIGKMMPKLGGSDTYDKTIITGGAGIGVASNAPLTVGIVAANRGYQKLYNQSQGLISRGIAKSLNAKPSYIQRVSDIIGGNGSGNIEDDLIKAAGSRERAIKTIKAISRGADKETKAQADEIVNNLQVTTSRLANPNTPEGTSAPAADAAKNTGKLLSSPVAAIGAAGAARLATQPGQQDVNSGTMDVQAMPAVDSGNIAPAPVLPPAGAKYIIDEEGYKPRVYYDTRNNKTIGYGFNLDQPNAAAIIKRVKIPESFEALKNGQPISESSANKLFDYTFNASQKAARRIVPSFDELGENQQAALTSMAFQMGSKALKGFKKTLRYLSEGNAKAVENQILNSLMAEQTPARAKRTALMLAYNLSPQQAEAKLLQSGRISAKERKYMNPQMEMQYASNN